MTAEDLPPRALTMDPAPKYSHRLSFHGEGGSLFLILLKTAILTPFTLGIYAAWGRARMLRFYSNNLELSGHRFRFLGTGKELFKGLLIGYGLLIGLVIVGSVLADLLGAGSSAAGTVATFALLTAAIVTLVLYANFSALRYRLSRTDYRGIRFRLGGEAWDFVIGGWKRIVLVPLTLGLYLPFFLHWRGSFLYNHMHYGQARLSFNGDAKTFFWLCLKALLIPLTLGIYFYWWHPQLLAYWMGNLRIRGADFRFGATPWETFKHFFVNGLLLFATFGIAMPWILIRNLRFIIDRLEIDAGLDIEAVVQGEMQRSNSLGEGMAEALDTGMDVGIGF